MRCTQIMGLTEEAKKFLEENCEMVSDMICPTCGEVITQKMNRSIYRNNNESGILNDDDLPLYSYVLKDERIIFETEQETKWSSGPRIFLCLSDEYGIPMFKWDQKVIDDC